MIITTTANELERDVVLTLDANTAKRLAFLLARNLTIPEALVRANDELSAAKITAFMTELCDAMRNAGVIANQEGFAA